MLALSRRRACVAALVAAVALSVAVVVQSASHASSHTSLRRANPHAATAIHPASAVNVARAAGLAKEGAELRHYIGAHDSDSASGGDNDETSQADSHYCNGCVPPLAYAAQAPIMNTTGAAGVTITPIYWAPAGTSFPAG